MNPWNKLSIEERRVIKEAVVKDYIASEDISEICRKYNISKLTYDHIVYDYLCYAKTRAKNNMSPEARAEYELWKMLNNYQGEDCGFNFL